MILQLSTGIWLVLVPLHMLCASDFCHLLCVANCCEGPAALLSCLACCASTASLCQHQLISFVLCAYTHILNIHTLCWRGHSCGTDACRAGCAGASLEGRGVMAAAAVHCSSGLPAAHVPAHRCTTRCTGSRRNPTAGLPV